MAEILSMPDAEVLLYRGFFPAPASDRFLEVLRSTIAWQQEHLRLYGRRLPMPRLTAWYGDEGTSYTYSGHTRQPQAWTPLLLAIKLQVEAVAAVVFNSVLLNLYRDGQDSVAWHSDDEPELGQEPVIGSVSFGATRQFQFKHKQHQALRTHIALTHGSLLLMRGATQHHWLHRIPKTTTVHSPRINLTFRLIQSSWRSHAPSRTPQHQRATKNPGLPSG
jgi:alkylated DNA repair dioxygenase AlkB